MTTLLQSPSGVPRELATGALRPGCTIRRISRTEYGPCPPDSDHPKIDYQQADQAFPLLYRTLVQIIKDCGACSRLDLAMIPALSRYNAFIIERALDTAEYHGLIHRIGLVHPNAATEDPDTQPIGIYDIDPLGPIDRDNTQDTIRRALARRCTLELSWFCVASNAQLDR
jgi:hypothetical protein